MLRTRFLALLSALALALAPAAALAQAQSAGGSGHFFLPAGPGAASPALSGCGTSPTLTAGSSDSIGSVLVGSTPTLCTITFATPFAAAPFCIVGGAITVITVSATVLTFNGTAGDVVAWICSGR